MDSESAKELFAELNNTLFLRLNDRGEVLAVNRKTCLTTGEMELELLGCAWVENFIDYQSQDEFSELMATILLENNHNQVHTLESHLRLRDSKSTRFIHWAITTHAGPDGSANIVALGYDLTDLNEPQSQINYLMSELPGAVFQYTAYPDGRDSIDYMSPGCKTIWEIEPELIRNDPTLLWAMVHQDDITGMRESVQASASNLSPWLHEWRITTPSGTNKWLRGSGAPVKEPGGEVVWNSIIVDISEQKRLANDVSNELLKTIHVLASAFDRRNKHLVGHEERVAKLAVLIGETLNLDEHTLEGLEMGAMVHDVGEMQISDAILSKEAPLTEREHKEIQNHPIIGAELLEGIHFDWPIQEMVLQHHERLDGSGYPFGLKGDDIILEARIIAVAEVAEAMLNNRPYRDSYPLNEVIEHFELGAGRYYDKDVCQAFIEIASKGKLPF